MPEMRPLILVPILVVIVLTIIRDKDRAQSTHRCNRCWGNRQRSGRRSRQRDSPKAQITFQRERPWLLQAGTIGQDREIMVLEMGESIRVADMARRLIELSGLKVGEDIDIVFIGLRPGEKESSCLSRKQTRQLRQPIMKNDLTAEGSQIKLFQTGLTGSTGWERNFYSLGRTPGSAREAASV